MEMESSDDGGGDVARGLLMEELAGLKEDSRVSRMVEWMEGARRGWSDDRPCSSRHKVSAPSRSSGRGVGVHGGRTPPLLPHSVRKGHGYESTESEGSSLLLKDYTAYTEEDGPYCEDLIKIRRIALPMLEPVERNFLELVKAGDVADVRDYIVRHPGLNLNCENYQGHTALHLAVKSDNRAMVEFLLGQPGTRVGDAHLEAVKGSSVPIVRTLLDRLGAVGTEATPPPGGAGLPPLVVAAQEGRYEIVGLLLDRGHTLTTPHPPDCYCKSQCIGALTTEDPLSHATGKLHVYKALANPSYICQTSEDPILTAFQLSEELKQASEIDCIYRREYEALSLETKGFAVALIAECRTSEEVETILSEKRGSIPGVTFPRLLLAMDYKQKEFIAHPNVQQTLLTAWYGSWQKWRTYGTTKKVMLTAPRILLVPFLPLVFMIAPGSELAKFFMIPINVMINSMAAYMYFLLFVFLQSNINKKNQKRQTKLTGIEFILLIFIVGFLANTVRMILMKGPRRFFSFVWNVHEVVMETVFFATFFFWLCAISYTKSSSESNLDRKYWHFLDPELIAESLFVIFTIVVFLRLLLIVELSYGMGPLQVSLGKMVIDCVRYSIIFTVLLIAFAAGLSRYYSYYEGMKQKNPKTGDETSQESSFTSFSDTVKTLFWGIFGMSSFENADVVIENLPNETGAKTVINEHYVTEFIGYITFAIYMILTVIVLLNMLIATMSNTFQRVIDNVDSEWVFGRTQVFLVYMDQTVLPVPYNLMPTGYGVFTVRSSKLHKYCPWCCPPLKQFGTPEEHKKIDFKVLMSQLVQRYFSKKGEM